MEIERLETKRHSFVDLPDSFICGGLQVMMYHKYMQKIKYSAFSRDRYS